MISNGSIRQNVTERIKPFRLKLLGYALVYMLIVGFIVSTINVAVALISGLIGAVVSIPIGAIFDLGAQNAKDIFEFITRSISSIINIFTAIITFILSVGFAKEILFSMINNSNKISPIDFIKLGFEDTKRLAMVYLRILLKNLPAIILLVFGSIVLFVGLLMGGGNIISILVSLLGFLIILSGIIWSIVIMLLYQTVHYELIHDEAGLSAKEILVKARNTIKGYIWQWTRMNYFYSFIAFLIMFLLTIVFAVIIGLSTYLTVNAGNAASVIGIIMMIIGVFAFSITIIAVTLLLQYFTAKNILNLDELYLEIQKEKREGVNPI